MGETFTERELERYARQIIMREIGGPGQRRLRGAKVLVVGAGGLGAPVILYLAAAGVGTIGVIDDDEVSLSNLHRQVIFDTSSIGRRKVDCAADAARALNPHIHVKPIFDRLTRENAEAIVKPYRMVIDGTDNFATRYLVNEVCVKRGVTLVSAAISQWEGQISVYKPGEGGPCYACAFPEPPADGLVPTCAEAGVIGPLAGVIGSMMAVEAIKDIARAGHTLAGRLMIYDALEADTRVFELERRPDCAVCGAQG